MGNSYKNTMNLPKTDFAMRANLPENEPKRLAKWEDEKLYWKVLEKNKDGKPFVLHDGPPYANGPIHIGHAFNKILKDFVIKSHAQRGFYTPYIPGWDCHGQPIEHMVEITLGPEKMAAIDQPTLRRLCREWAEKYVDVQRDGFKRLGVNADWEHPYLTFTPGYEAGNVEIFKKMYLDGAIYRGRKPIHWCKSCHTALAEAEIEYSDETSPSIYVKFKLDSVPGVFEAAGVDGNAFVLIWTTTPWTLPANTAVSLAPDADYVMVEVEGSYLLMAKELVEQVAETAGWEAYTVVEGADGEPVMLKGRELYGLTYTAPVRQDLKGTVIYGDHVTLDTGTGAVHTAPGHGQDDYLVSLEFDIPLLMPVDDNGRFTDEAGQFSGLDTDEANPVIIEWLREQGTLVAEKKITHSYPHCWRCHQPVIFRATDQWFVSMDKTHLRDTTMRVIENDVTWIPEWAVNRIGSMVADRPDWCISRQRSWGVPIPVFKCAKCGSTVATEETFDAVIELFRTEGADAWFTKDPSEYLPQGVACEVCGSHELVPEKDILDVWWESGVSHTSVCKYRSDEGLTFPADMYLEGSDQHRGWFQSSILTSVGAYGVAPYKSVMHCGFTMDAEGKKMSKSAGNGIDPADVMAKSGADVLRLWVSSVDYSQDVNIGDEILERTSEAYRRIRNTFRFLLGNLDDFDFRCDAVSSWDDLSPLDQWALVRVLHLLHDVEAAYDAYKYHLVYRAVYEYIVGDLSAVYMDALKDRLYSEASDSLLRRGAQTVLANILEVLVRILAPILSFTTDEVWEAYPEGLRYEGGHPKSVQLAGWPEDSDFLPVVPEGGSESISEAFGVVLGVREVVMKALEEARGAKEINKSQEAAIEITAPRSVLDYTERFAPEVFEELFIVSQVAFSEGDELSVRIGHASGEKCPRCWNYRELGGNPNHPDVCERCADALDAIGYKE
ncbi:isoleucine--tRNA ligase [Raoultibacter phocaeensis]|uniref:isoleucine--tRNA ligase n=1 Tax=Raoultibacter phocaeensis TaxID=2479841 RepID=UPI00111BC6F5|nr:isoleucine--tRNA ligase [Raoultibacter phocaeensis]